MANLTRRCRVQRLVGGLLVPGAPPPGRIINGAGPQGQVVELKMIANESHEFRQVISQELNAGIRLFCIHCGEVGMVKDWQNALAEPVQNA